jgi:hypothetical protein
VQITARIFTSRRSRIYEVEKEVDDKAKDDQWEKWFMLVYAAGKSYIGEGSKQGAMNDGADRKPEERTTIVVRLNFQ